LLRPSSRFFTAIFLEPFGAAGLGAAFRTEVGFAVDAFAVAGFAALRGAGLPSRSANNGSASSSEILPGAVEFGMVALTLPQLT